MRILIEFQHGLGDTVQLSSVLAHLRHYRPDWQIDVATLVVDGVKRTEPPVTLPPPPLVALKDQVWHRVSATVSQ